MRRARLWMAGLLDGHNPTPGEAEAALAGRETTERTAAEALAAIAAAPRNIRRR